MDPGPAKNPQPEGLGAWVAPPSQSERQNALMRALMQAAMYRRQNEGVGGLEPPQGTSNMSLVNLVQGMQ